MFGKLNWSAIPFDQPIPLITSAVIILLLLGVLALVTVKGWWPYLWREWITSGMAAKKIMIVPCAEKIWL
jgi:cytochrome o ubiquinol oxidase subunit 1